MKKQLVLMVMVCATLSSGCNSVAPLSEVKSIQNQMGITDQLGNILYVQTTAFGNSKNDAEKKLYIETFEAILFKGIPGSPYSSPLVTNESQSRSEHSVFYDSFFQNLGCREFIVSTTHDSEPSKSKGAWKKEAHFEIDMKRLRNHLEANNVIKKFGL